MSAELTSMEEFEGRVSTLSPLGQFAERLRLHAYLGGAITADAVRSCASSAKLDLEPWQWLESTADLQSNTYGYDLEELQNDPAKLAKYVMWNLFAIYQETGEMGVEFSWAPWATDKPFVNRDRMLAEAVDLGHFIGNILVGMGVTDAEYETAYRAKQAKNRRRQESGTYSKQKGTLGEGSENE